MHICNTFWSRQTQTNSYTLSRRNTHTHTQLGMSNSSWNEYNQLLPILVTGTFFIMEDLRLWSFEQKSSMIALKMCSHSVKGKINEYNLTCWNILMPQLARLTITGFTVVQYTFTLQALFWRSWNYKVLRTEWRCPWFSYQLFMRQIHANKCFPYWQIYNQIDR